MRACYRGLMIFFACLASGTPTAHATQSFGELKILDATKCFDSVKRKAPGAKLLPPLRKSKEMDLLFVDFSGDGLCDVLAAVPYPYSSQSASYLFHDLILLGTNRGWRKIPPVWRNEFLQALTLSKPLPETVENYLDGFVDATNAVFLTPGPKRAPFVLGIQGGVTSLTEYPNGCTEFGKVFQWSDQGQIFTRVSAAKEKEVLDYYYSKLAKPCPRK
jgi:hypothetical protein